MDKIVILGRGESLKKLKNFNEKIDTIILVNEFWKTTYNPIPFHTDPLIHNFIKDKKIILIFSKCAETENVKDLQKKYNVIKAFVNLFPHSVEKKIFKRDEYKHNLDINCLPEEMIKHYMYQKNNCRNVGSLALAISYAKHILKIKEIHIFGLDFYEKDYYLENKICTKKERNKSNLIKEDWKTFLRYNNDIKFNINTYANFTY